MRSGDGEDMPHLTLEITPPSKRRLSVLLRRALTFESLSRRINVIQRRERWSSLEASIALLGHRYEPVWHLANRGRSFATIEAEIGLAREAGIGRVLCIRGEYKAEDSVDSPKIREVVRLLAREHPAAHISVTLNHHVRGPRVLENLLAKLDAGARGVQTQVTFDLESLRPFAEVIGRDYPDVGVTPMLMPVLSARAAVRLSRRLAVPLPPGLLYRLEKFGPDAGWDHFRDFASAIARSALYDGLAVMTPIDPSPEFSSRLRTTLEECRSARRGE